MVAAATAAIKTGDTHRTKLELVPDHVMLVPAPSTESYGCLGNARSRNKHQEDSAHHHRSTDHEYTPSRYLQPRSLCIYHFGVDGLPVRVCYGKNCSCWRMTCRNSHVTKKLNAWPCDCPNQFPNDCPNQCTNNLQNSHNCHAAFRCTTRLACKPSHA